jgi:hypothetical protein
MRYLIEGLVAVLLLLMGASLTQAEDCTLKRLANVELDEAADADAKQTASTN